MAHAHPTAPARQPAVQVDAPTGDGRSPARPGHEPGGHAHQHARHLLHLVPGPDIAVPAAASLLAVDADRAAALLDRLVADGLCERTAPGRYRPLPTAPGRAAGRPGDTAARRRLIDHYLHSAYRADRIIAPHHPELPLDPVGQGCVPEEPASRDAALTWLDEEHAPLVAVRELARDTGHRLAVFQLANCLNGHYVRRGHTAPQLEQWADALRAAHALGDPEAQITAHRYAGQAASRAGRHTEAVAQLERAVRIAERHGEPGPQAWAYYIFAWVEEMAGRDEAALRHAVCAAGLFRRAQQRGAEADALNAAGWYHTRLGDLAQAERYCARALEISRQHHYRGGEAAALDSLGLLAQQTGRHDEAVAASRAALELCRALGNTYQEAGTLDRLGDSYAATGRLAEAHDAWARAVDLYRDQCRPGEAESVEWRLATIS
ncbi:tetratricopeptide repeat protein [Streptomyces sp. NPDC046805]|uniref:tetratricopeptide repeat protein n=1 Tax=Streptomyces sp. NPDC046805 TaxID=3155134 RepID=UPI0034105CF5